MILSFVAWAHQTTTQPISDPNYLKNDIEIGKKYSEQVDKLYKTSKNAEYQERVNRIGKELAKIANETSVKVLWGDKKLNIFDYQFKVLEGDDVNAFSLPGGYLYFFEGLLKYVESDDELAGVIAHEIAHASLRHIYTLQKEQNKMDVIRIPVILVAIFSGGSTGGDIANLAGLVGTALGSGWSQKAEEAADYAGYQYMRKSPYNPVAMLTFMERLAYDEFMKPQIDWGIFRTHPPTRERIDALLQRLNEDGIPIKRSLVTQSYRTQLKPGKDGGVEAWFHGKLLYVFAGDDAQARAEKAAHSINEFMDSIPDLFDLSSSPNGTIRGRNRALWRVTEDDAKHAKKTLGELVNESVKALKQTLFNMTYRITDLR